VIDPDFIETSNPHGPLDPGRLAQFEARLGAPLPADYAAYLRDHNGGDLKRPFHTAEPDFCVHHMFGLHDGPTYARLTDWHDLGAWYDLGARARRHAHLLAFGDTTTGDALLIDMRDGRIAVFLHDSPASSDLPITYIASGFSAFLGSLISEADYNASLSEDDDFQRRLAEMEAQRAAEVAAYLKRRDES